MSRTFMVISEPMGVEQRERLLDMAVPQLAVIFARMIEDAHASKAMSLVVGTDESGGEAA